MSEFNENKRTGQFSPMKDVVDKLMRANTSHLPVVTRNDNRLVGYITWKDLMRVRDRLKAEERERTSFLMRPRRNLAKGTGKMEA